jgi:hypothetical protein
VCCFLIYLFRGIELTWNGGLRVAASGCARASELDCRCCRRKHMRRGSLVGGPCAPACDLREGSSLQHVARRALVLRTIATPDPSSTPRPESSYVLKSISRSKTSLYRASDRPRDKDDTTVFLS